jgi:hypothetical protein
MRFAKRTFQKDVADLPDGQSLSVSASELARL